MVCSFSAIFENNCKAPPYLQRCNEALRLMTIFSFFDIICLFINISVAFFSYLGYLPISGYEIGLEDPGCIYVSCA